MPIKVRSTFRKQELEYESPDGEKWLINYVENEGRKYISIGKEEQDEKDFTTWDVPMLLDIADQIRGMTSRIPKKTTRPKLRSPKVKDHRNEGDAHEGDVHEGLERSNQIDEDVQKSMSNYDDKVPPMESFASRSNDSQPKATQDEWFGVRTGLDPAAAIADVEDTPQEFKNVNEAPNWVDRSDATRMNRPNITKGAKGDKFKRVGAGDIV